MNRLLVIGFCLSAIEANAAQSTPRIYIEPQDGFESYLSAAIVKKRVPVIVTQDRENATFILTSSVKAKEESTGSKVARCLFAYCAGIQGTQSATVQLINIRTKDVTWGYNVIKGSAAAYQSTAEAAAKHLKHYLETNPVTEAQGPRPAPTSTIDPPPPPAPPTEIKPGMTMAQVEAALGTADRSTKFADKEIRAYGNLKVTFVEGKVANVE